MELEQRQKSHDSILRFEIRHSLLWIGVPLVSWDVYQWWRHRESLGSPSWELKLGELLIDVLGDLTVPIFVGLVFVGTLKLMRRRRLQKEAQIQLDKGSDE